MNLTLIVTSGPLLGREFNIDEDESAEIGNGGQADIIVPDQYLSHLHFSIECLDEYCRVRDLHSNNGTRVNGILITEHTLTPGDHIVAGRTSFEVRLGDPLAASPAVAAGHFDLAQNDVPETLCAAPARLYAILDAARATTALEFLERRIAPENWRSLYEGPERVHLAAYAPYLADLTDDEESLTELIADGWGESWGVFLSSHADLDQVRHHLRRFLIVDDDTGRKLYFRYYDPRVLRTFLPTCSRVQAEEFFGPVLVYWCESHDGDLLLQYWLAQAATESARRMRLSEVP